MDPTLAIYPTARKVEELLKRQCSRTPRLGHRIMTFPQLVDGLWRECGASRVALSPIAERLALDEALGDPAIRSIEGFAPAPGLLDCLQGVIREFKSAALEPDDLREATRTLSGDAARRVQALTTAFAGYEKVLASRRLADRHDRERLALQYLLECERRGSRPRFLDGVSELLVAEIYDFSLLQFMMVVALIRIIGNAVLTIQAELHPISVARFAELTWNRFVEEQSIADKALPDFARRGGRSGQLGFVVRHLFGPSDGETCPAFDGSVRVIEAPNAYREIEEVGRAIRRALERPEPLAPNRIAVLARDLKPYAGYLTRVFDRYRLPLRMREARPLAAAPSARLVLDILRIPLEDYPRESLEKLVAVLPVGARRHRWALKDCGYMNRKTRALGECLANRRRKLERAQDALKADAPERERLAGRIARLEQAAQALDEFVRILERLAAPSSVVEHVGRLKATLRELGLESPSQAPNNAREWAAVAETLEEISRAAALVSPNRSLELNEFAALFESVAGETVVDANGAERGPFNAVQALEVADARGLDFDLVFIIGLFDGGFPLYRSEDPLLADELKLALDRPLRDALRRRLGRNAPSAPGRILRTRADRNSEDWFLFFLALSTAEREVVVSYPMSDQAGNPMGRSPFVSEVIERLAPSAEQVVRGAPSGPAITAPEDCFARGEFLNYAARRELLSGDLAPTLGEPTALDRLAHHAALERRRQAYLVLPPRELNDGRPDPAKLELVDAFDGRVTGDARLRRMLLGDAARPAVWSPTSLNELAACGFKFLCARLLKLKADEELDYEPSALETGTLTHRVLERLLARGLDFGSVERARRDARALLDELYEQERAQARDPAFFELTWRNLERIVDEVVELEVAERTTGRPADQILLEHEGSCTLAEPGAAEGLTLSLKGRVDRLDLFRDRAGRIERIRVLDYKTSRNLNRYSKLANPGGEHFGRTEFQLAVYLMAALEECGPELAESVALEAGYLVLRHWRKRVVHSVPRALVEPDPAARARIAVQSEPASIVDRVIALARAALAGEFDVDPLQCDDYCPFRRVCRYEKPQTGARAEVR